MVALETIILDRDFSAIDEDAPIIRGHCRHQQQAIQMDPRLDAASEGEAVPQGEMNGPQSFFVLRKIADEASPRVGSYGKFCYVSSVSISIE